MMMHQMATLMLWYTKVSVVSLKMCGYPQFLQCGATYWYLAVKNGS